MLDQNMHYGENEILRKEPVPYTLIAMTHTHVIVLMRNELENLLKKSQALQDSLRFSNFDGKTQLENGQETHSRL
jgi:CRP-like cAMP-binding protein